MLQKMRYFLNYYSGTYYITKTEVVTNMSLDGEVAATEPNGTDFDALRLNNERNLSSRPILFLLKIELQFL